MKFLCRSHRECGARGRRSVLASGAGLRCGCNLGTKWPCLQGPRPRAETSTDSPRLLDACGQLLHEVVHIPVLADHACDLGGRVDDGGVVAAAELLADLG